MRSLVFLALQINKPVAKNRNSFGEAPKWCWYTVAGHWHSSYSCNKTECKALSMKFKRCYTLPWKERKNIWQPGWEKIYNKYHLNIQDLCPHASFDSNDVVAVVDSWCPCKTIQLWFWSFTNQCLRNVYYTSNWLIRFKMDYLA